MNYSCNTVPNLYFVPLLSIVPLFPSEYPVFDVFNSYIPKDMYLTYYAIPKRTLLLFTSKDSFPCKHEQGAACCAKT